MKDKNKPKKGGLSILKYALGAAAFGGAGFMYATHKDEVDQVAKDKYKELQKVLKENRKEVEKKVKHVWGQVNKEGMKTYEELKKSLLKALEKENLGKSGEFLKKNYEKIVEQIVQAAKDSKFLDKQTRERLADLFKTDWDLVKNVLADRIYDSAQEAVTKLKQNDAAKKVRKDLIKSVKNAEKTVKKAAKAQLKKMKKTQKIEKSMKQSTSTTKKVLKKTAKNGVKKMVKKAAPLKIVASQAKKKKSPVKAPKKVQKKKK